MGYRTHWTSPRNLSVETMRANDVPGVVDEQEDEPVLVLLDHGNQEGLVLEGGPADWRHLAGLILTRVEFYEKGVT